MCIVLVRFYVIFLTFCFALPFSILTANDGVGGKGPMAEMKSFSPVCPVFFCWFILLIQTSVIQSPVQSQFVFVPKKGL